MFERPHSGERAVLVRLEFARKDAQETLAEFRELALSAGASCVGQVSGHRSRPDPRLFVGSGKLEEILGAIRAGSAELVLFDHALSPSQERNLEAALDCRVLDRTGLILDIFAQRARSYEGKLQVELAQLKHLATRLVRGWSHLERQKGGIGLRGPGEKQLETDRRLLAMRIKQINRRLDKVRGQREQGRQARRKAAVPTVSLVGYTNAGKSTLFNHLTRAGVYASEKLFATLDPTLRRLALPNGLNLVLVDTVGFIRDLPHELVEAFRATLEETRDASLLLHVIDSADEGWRQRVRDVEAVLASIEASGVPQILVFNKQDVTGGEPKMERSESGRVTRIWLSSKTGAGIELLQEALQAYFGRDRVHGWVKLSPRLGRMRAQLFRHRAVVKDQQAPDGGWLMEIDMDRKAWQALSRREKLPANTFLFQPQASLAATARAQ